MSSNSSRTSAVTFLAAPAMTMYLCGLCSRAVILFLTGSFLATLKLFQDITETRSVFSLGLMNSLSYTWWIPLMIGAFACLIGLIYPCIDSKLGEPHYFRREWTSVVRCIVVFVGINHFSTVSFSAAPSAAE